MAPRTHDPSGFAAQAILSHFAKGIAEAVLKFDRRDDSATLDQLDERTRTEYEQIGELYALMTDKASLHIAFYAAADEMVAGGIDRLSPSGRAQAVALFIRAFKTMKLQLLGQAPHETAALMRALVARDTADGIDAQPVNAKPAPTLAELDTTGVQ